MSDPRYDMLLNLVAQGKTVRQMAPEIHVSSTQTVHAFLKELESLGMVTKPEHTRDTWKITEKGEKYLHSLGYRRQHGMDRSGDSGYKAEFAERY